MHGTVLDYDGKQLLPMDLNTNSNQDRQLSDINLKLQDAAAGETDELKLQEGNISIENSDPFFVPPRPLCWQGYLWEAEMYSSPMQNKAGLR